jgi:putative ABC transport system permease protein
MPKLSPLLLRAGLRYLLRHRWQGLLALTGIALGVAVVLAVDLANHAARAAFELSAAQLQGKATHRLVSLQDSLPESVYVTLHRQPDAPPMAPVVTGQVRVEGQPGRYRLLGLDLFAEGPFRDQLPSIVNGQDFLRDWLTRPDALALSGTAASELGVRLGERLSLVHQGLHYPLTVLAIDPATGAGSEDLLVVDIATAQAALGLDGRLSHVDLILDDVAEQWLRQRLPTGTELVSVADQAAGVTRLSAAFELNLTAMSLLALLVGMFLIFNAMSFSIVQRRTLLGRLRAVGVTDRELFQLILAESLVVSVVGTVLGLLLGVWLGQGLTAIVSATVSELYYQVSADAAQLDAWLLLKASVLGIGATLLATLVPARQAAQTPPLTTLSRAALEQHARLQLPRWTLAGMAALAAGLALALLIPGGVVQAFAGLFLLVLGAALVTPMAIHVLHRLLTRLRLPGVWRMGVRDLDRHMSRLAIAVAALMVALSASVGVAVMVDSMRGAVNDWLADLLNADLYIAAENFADDVPLPQAVVSEAATLPGVTAVSRYRHRDLPLAGRPVELVAAELAPASRAGFSLLGSAPGAVWPLFDRGGVLISEPLANRLRLGPGDSLAIDTPGGAVEFAVAGLFRDYASEHGRIFMAETHYQRHWSDREVDTLALFGSDADTAALRRAASAHFADRFQLVYTPAQAILDESMAVFDRTFRVTEVLRALSLLVAFIGVLSALMALQLERGKEYAVLRALGLTRTQVAGLIVGESLVMGLIAALLALPSGMLMAWVLTESVQRRAFGWTMPFQVDAAPLLETLLVGLLAALLAGLYPAWRSAQRNPAPQLRED